MASQQATLSTATVTVRSFRVADATWSLRHKVSRRSIALSLRNCRKDPRPPTSKTRVKSRLLFDFRLRCPVFQVLRPPCTPRDTSCTKAVAGPRKRPDFWAGLESTRGSLNTQNHETRALSRVSGHEAASQLAGCTSGAAHMAKRNFIFDEGSVEAVERLRKQDEAFCRRLRVAVEMGDEFCPTTVITAPCTSGPVSNYMRTRLIMRASSAQFSTATVRVVHPMLLWAHFCPPGGSVSNGYREL